jgi:membrane protein DedA with SNARE-associated domain/rhodanese-related sulfurtransferase
MPPVQHWVGHLRLPILFLLVFLQQAGVPYPVTPLLIIAGAAAASGSVNAGDVIAIAAIAALTADLGWYFAGLKLGGRALRALCTLSLSPDSCVSDSERYFLRFGPRVLVFAKLVPALGLVSTAMSGVVRSRIEAFLLYDAIGNVIWATAAVSVGVLFHGAVGDVLNTLSALGAGGVLLVAGLLLAFVAYRAWQRYALIRELRLARISVAELKELLDAEPRPIIIDARAPSSRQLEGSIPGSIPVELLKLDTTHHSLARDREVIVYCACPNEASAARVAKQLKRLGLLKVRPLTGGIFAWKDAGFEVQAEPAPLRVPKPGFSAY